MASSTELSTTSHTQWCSPVGPVLPMYIPGRFRTGSRPSKTCMSLAPYDWVCCATTRLSACFCFGVSLVRGTDSDQLGNRDHDGKSLPEWCDIFGLFGARIGDDFSLP